MRQTHCKIFPAYLPISVETWVWITVVRVSLDVIADTQPGNCECQTVVCPRTSLLFFTAQFTRVSRPPKLNFPCEGSVVSHFPLQPPSQLPSPSSVACMIYLFSGVTCPKSAIMTAAFEVWLSEPESALVPKYSLPSFLKMASMLASARSASGAGVFRPKSSFSQSILKIS